MVVHGHGKTFRSTLAIIGTVTLCAGLIGCSSGGRDSASESASHTTASGAKSDAAASPAASGSAKAADTGSSADSAASASGATGSSAADASRSSTSADAAASTSVAPRAPVPPGKDDSQQQARAGVLTAGEWSDLGHWSDWLRLTGSGGQWGENVAQWGFRGWQKVTVEVKSEGKKVTDASVTLSSGQGSVIWQAKTNNEGQAVLFVKQSQGQTNTALRITVDSGGETGSYDNVDLSNPLPVVVELKRPVQQQTNVADIMFVMDTTGSMGDELEYIKTELKNVITRIEDANEQDGSKLRTRVSTNFYRDQGDDYVVRPFPFTEDIDESVREISKQRAEGGGDYEEAVEQGLDDAINRHQWSRQARARLLFLVLDAPPHHTDAIVTKIQSETAQAAAAGIRIIPIASSGVDKNTEFLLRSMAIATGGTYVFLTDHSGVGNSHIEPTIGSYQVEHLNDLLVQIASRYIRTPAAS